MKGRKVWFGIVVTAVLLAIPLTVTAETSRYYYDATLLLISRGYSIIDINGSHEVKSGQGHDDKVTLHGHRLGFHLFIIETSSQKIHEACIYSKVELFNYDGWMFGHDQLTLLNKIPLKLYGHCEKIKITVYRG
jgi:hypothetical protein